MARLIGQKEIEHHVRFSWNTIKQWIENEGFPAIKQGGVWISDTEEIDKWFKSLILRKAKGYEAIQNTMSN